MKLMVQRAVLIVFVAIVMISVTMPVALGQSGGQTVDSNLVCEQTSPTSAYTDQTELGGLLAQAVNAIVAVGFLVAVVGGTAYTVADAARPGQGEYKESRNDAIKFGFGALVILYGLNAVASQINAEFSFRCLLPGFA